MDDSRLCVPNDGLECLDMSVEEIRGPTDVVPHIGDGDVGKYLVHDFRTASPRSRADVLDATITHEAVLNIRLVSDPITFWLERAGYDIAKRTFHRRKKFQSFLNLLDDLSVNEIERPPVFVHAAVFGLQEHWLLRVAGRHRLTAWAALGHDQAQILALLPKAKRHDG